jgi:small subunit ribosomal protein S17
MTDEMNDEATTADDTRAGRKTRQGVVVSDKMDKTITVLLTRRFSDPKYGKQVTRSTKVKARNNHDAKAGDLVRIMETRPVAKTVRWRTVAVVERAR